ncbi:RHS repeat-associated core domain-containing protein [Thalassomonas haliotis]
MRLNSLTGSGSEGYNFGQNDSYDSRGNVTDNGKRSFQYNLAGQMIASGSNRYLYDGYNRRIKTTDSKGASYSLYSQSGRLMYRETVKGGINYIFLGDKLVAKQGSGVVTKSDDPDYNSVMSFKPFGEAIEAPNDEVGYTGHKFDTDLGLSYMQARYYDPIIGRFYSNDPTGWTAASPVHSYGRYTYANNNPYKYTDPNGEFPVLGFVAGVALEVTRQALTGEIQDTSFSGIAKNAGKALISGLAGATGAGLASKAASLSLAGRTVANTASGAAIGVTSTAGNNAIDGKPLTEDLGKGAAFGAAGGLVGSASGDLVDAATSAVKGNASFATKQITSHINEATGQTLGVTIKSSSVGVADVVGNTLGNSTGIVDCKSNNAC